MAQTQSKTPGRVEATNTLVNMTAAATVDVLELQTGDIERLAIEIVVTDQALDVFTLLAKVHQDSEYVVIDASITATPDAIVLAASGTLTTQAADSTGWALLDVRAFHSVKFQASMAVDGGDLTIRARGHGTV